ncbi:MAG: hypothetical protein ACOYOU_11085 [Kiritimatiellia bacterium]
MKQDRFISGIFNTCDYWCERCAFTGRCRNFAMGRELEREARGEEVCKDATNAAFWNRLADQVREKAIFGATEARTEGVDVDLMPDPSWEARHDAQQQAVKRHPLVRTSHDYMLRAGNWLKTADHDLKAVAQGLLEAASNIATHDYEEQAREIGEMIEVVAWYHTLIPPKLARAVNGLLERNETSGELAGVIAESRCQDANGSGKVVLIAIERSIAAWVRLREILPNHEDEILAMLALLSRLQRGIRVALPGAQAFQRPGFDGIALDDTDESDMA